MVRAKRYLIPLAVACLWGSVCGASDGPAVIRSLHDVATLSNGMAARQLPAEFEATVTYFRIYEKTLFVQDGEDAVYVNASTSLALAPGDRILIRGTTQASFRPVVFSSDIVLLRHGNPPVPVRTNYSTMILSKLDTRYVTTRGRVTAANLTKSSGHPVSTLAVHMDGGFVGITADSADESLLEGLLDAEIEVTGVVSGQFDGKMQQTGLLMHCMSMKDVKVLSRPPVDAWSVPLIPMDRVLESAYVIDRSKRVRVRGTLTYYHQTSMAVLQDGNRSIRVRSPQITRLNIGDHAEAIGIPSVDNEFLTLNLGEIRATGGSDPVVPRPLNWDQVASGKFAFDLVSVEGTVVTQVRERGKDIYVISSGGNLFSATVRHPFVYEWNVHRDPPPMPVIRPGSRVRVTGVDSLDDGNPFNGATAFEILMRSHDDVAVLARPPWLDVHHLLQIAAGLLLMVMSVSLWGAMLRLKVQRQKAVLARRMEEEAARERSRGRILEDINANRPLREILEQIAAFVSLRIKGAPCWLQVSNGAPVGNAPSQDKRLQVVRQEIRSMSGPLHGTLSVGLEIGAAPGPDVAEALSWGAGLATLAVDTHGLYSDLVHRSEFDLLTDLHNRFSLEKHLDAWLADVRERGEIFGLVYIDLDDFKLVNDRHGHRMGDVCLQEAAERMRRQLRPGDILARIGGDEFAALVLSVRSRADVEEIALRLERCFDEPVLLDGYRLQMSATVGVSVYPEDGTTKDALLGAADTAMYASKHRRPQAGSVARLETRA